MQSICPSCKNQIEHEDFLFEVVCANCKTRFNPFMQQMDVPAENAAGLTPAASEPSAMGMLDMSAPQAEGAQNFSESNQVFQELRDYGETLQEPPPSADGGTPGNGAAGGASPSMGGAAPMMVAVATDCAMTTGDALAGHQIEAYLNPVSVWADLDGASPNPLKPAFDQISQQSKAQGGNGLLGLRWQLGADGKVVMTGIPVRCAKL